MTRENSDLNRIRWFSELPAIVRYRFSTQWMKDEASGISIAKLAECLVEQRRDSETFVKSFRSYDFKTGELKNVWRPVDGYSKDDVHQICEAINRHRAKIGRKDNVSATEFYQRAWDELHQQFPLQAEPMELPAQEVAPVVAEKQADLEVDSESDQTLIIEPIKPTETDEPQSIRANMPVKQLGLAAVVLLLAMAGIMWRFNGQQTSPAVSQATVKKDHANQSMQKYLPGTVVQLRQLDQANQLVDLDPPEHYLAAANCYPNLTAESQLATFGSYQQLQNIPLTALERLTTLAPTLTDNSLQLRDYVVKFVGLNRREVSKGMINLGISDTCKQAMQQVLDFGNQLEDYGIIKQTFVADSIEFDLAFDDSATEPMINQISDKLVSFYSGATVNVVKGDDEQGKSRQVNIVGPVAVAYVSQQMSARISNTGSDE